ncbi:positive regulator of sigma E activity [Bacillus mesophilus]|uniref:Uncharacterized protein n=1 Tax=Bacillus mesophilus TaxID=1808955 RepID=A0A6M0Q4Q4_9BACI|nr:hypothetical protein [Bacillus mesophilus]MBM7661103.1 positive regulator of sigma E activity [Bacillus mesophilus]NEY71365.1 hypothetical protein [Bacillus mesophilus]
MHNRMSYLGLKILGLTIFIVPLLLKALGILFELSKPTVMILIILGVVFLLLGDVLKRKYKRKAQKSGLKVN